MTMQELAAADTASVHCKPTDLTKPKRKQKVLNYFAIGQKPRSSSIWRSDLKWVLTQKHEFEMCLGFILIPVNLCFPGCFLHIYPWDSWGNHVVRKRGKKHDTACSRVAWLRSQQDPGLLPFIQIILPGLICNRKTYTGYSKGKVDIIPSGEEQINCAKGITTAFLYTEKKLRQETVRTSKLQNLIH